MVSAPPADRIEALLDLWRREIFIDGELKVPDEYHDWDHIIECSDEMSFDEWEWCRENFRVRVDVSVEYGDDDDPADGITETQHLDEAVDRSMP